MQAFVSATGKVDGYEDPSDKFWAIYLREAEKSDKDLVEDWKGTMDGILIFSGLFSAVITSFIIESYKTLSPDPADMTVAVLAHLSQQLVTMTNSSLATRPYVLPPIEPATNPGLVNALWFLSLFLSLSCALIATLAQQWARHYKQTVERYHSSRKRGRIRAYLFNGLDKYRMTFVVEAIPALLHISLFLFIVGLFVFLFPVNRVIAYLMLGAIVSCAVIYVTTSIIPVFLHNYPYRTPLSTVLRHITDVLFKRPLGTLSRIQERAAQKSHRECVAQAFAFTEETANEDREYEDLLETIPDLFESKDIKHQYPATLLPFAGNTAIRSATVLLTLSQHQATRLGNFLHRCSTLRGDLREKTLTTCLRAIWTLSGPSVSSSEHWFWAQTAIKYTNDDSPEISDLALAVTALTTARWLKSDFPRIPLSKILARLRVCREYSKVLEHRQDSSSSCPLAQPFVALFDCFASLGNPYGILRLIVTLLRSPENNVQRSFANCFSATMDFRHRDPLSMDEDIIKRVLDAATYLDDPAAVDVVRSTLASFIQSNLNDTPAHAALTTLLSRGDAPRVKLEPIKSATGLSSLPESRSVQTPDSQSLASITDPLQKENIPSCLCEP